MTTAPETARPGRRLSAVAVRAAGLRLHGWHRRGPATGHALPVVLVHGLGVSGIYLRRLGRLLAVHHPVWIPELPGHGRSDDADVPLDVPGLAASLLAWMDGAGLARALLVGQSLGCQVVAELAARHPERAAALVLVSPTPDPETRSLPGAVLRLLADVPRERISLVPVVVADYLRAGPRLIAAEYRAMVEHPMAGALRAVRARGVPCAVVRGEHDPVVGAAWARRVARLAGAPDPVTVSGAGHAVQHSAPAAVAEVVRAVLAGPARAGRRPRHASAGRPASR